MSSLANLAASQPARTLADGEVLIARGDPGGNLYILESGQLSVERAGVVLATISQPGALVGEMSLLLGTRYTATVRAAGVATVRTIADAETVLKQDPEMSFYHCGAARGAARGDIGAPGAAPPAEPGQGRTGLFAKLFSALTSPADEAGEVTRHDLF